MKEQIKVSIIIPAYNTADVIQRPLKSVEDQTYQNYELIIINDGSTDGTKEFLDNYQKDKNNVIVYHQTNQGVSAARNKGIELATGDFICFLDSDDSYHPEFLEKMLNRHNETGGDVIYTGYNNFNENIEITSSNPLHFDNGDILPLYYTKGYFIHFSGMIINRLFLISNKIYFEVGQKISEDVFFTIKCFNNTKVYAVDEYLLNYFYRHNSAMNSTWDDSTWISDLDGNKKAINYIKTEYKSDIETRNEVIEKSRYRLFEREFDYLFYLMLKLKFNKINDYLNNNDVLEYGYENSKHFSRSNLKKYKFITSKNKFFLTVGYIYYKFIRFNFKKKNVKS